MPYLAKVNDLNELKWEAWNVNWEDNSKAWEDYYHLNDGLTLVVPKDKRNVGFKLITNLSFNSRGNGAESITFNAFEAETSSNFLVGAFIS